MSGKQSITHYLQAAAADAVSQAAVYLKQGELVVFPTDTVYGLGTNAFDEAALLRLYQIKQRPLHKGIPILLADFQDLAQVASHVPPTARRYIEQFWPGPLTLIVPKHPALPASLSPNAGVAVRIPDCDLTRALIRAAGGAIATSSANLTDQPPAQTAAQAQAVLEGLVAAILDDGPSPQNIASTIVDCTTPLPTLLRPGPITSEQLSLAQTKTL